MSATSGIRYLHEDNHVIVVEKPFNLPTQEDESRDPDLLTLVRAYLKKKYEKPGNVYLGLVHRLDRPAGGLLVLAKTSKAASRLSSQFRERNVFKIYSVMVSGFPNPPSKTLVNYLEKDRIKNRVTAYAGPRGNAKKAVLNYEVVETGEKFSLMNVTPETGRPHQIRVQLAKAGHPIVGDLKYGAPEALTEGNIMLFADGLGFAHPVTKEKMEFNLPLPQNWTVS